MIRHDPDRHLLSALKACEGNQQAELFAQLHDRHRERVHALCRRLTRNEEDALDALQETFIAVSSELERFRGEARLSTWLHRIAVNKCGGIRRRRSRRLRLEEQIGPAREGESPLAWMADDAPLPPALADESERHARVREVVGALPGWLREVVRLRYFEQLSYEEIAEALELPVGTVKSRLFRAHRMLAEELQPLALTN